MSYVLEAREEELNVLVDVAVVLEEVLLPLDRGLVVALDALGLRLEVEAEVLVHRRGHALVVLAGQLLLEHAEQLDPALVGVLLLVAAAVLGLLGEAREGVVEDVEEDEWGHVLAQVHRLVEVAEGRGDGLGLLSEAAEAHV